VGFERFGPTSTAWEATLRLKLTSTACGAPSPPALPFPDAGASPAYHGTFASDRARLTRRLSLVVALSEAVNASGDAGCRIARISYLDFNRGTERLGRRFKVQKTGVVADDRREGQ
jgi:hypothetical protein